MSKTKRLTPYEESLVWTVTGAYGVTRGCAIANLFPDKASQRDHAELAAQNAKWQAERKAKATP